MSQFLTNPLVLTVSLTSMISLFLPAIFYSVLSQKLSGSALPLFVIESLLYLSILWAFNILTSINASTDRCAHYNVGSAMRTALYPAVAVFIAFYIVFLFPILKRPLQGILENMQNQTLANAIIVGFFMMLFSWPGSVIHYFKSVQNGCKMTSKSMKDFRTKMAQRLEVLEEDSPDDYVELK